MRGVLTHLEHGIMGDQVQPGDLRSYSADLIFIDGKLRRNQVIVVNAQGSIAFAGDRRQIPAGAPQPEHMGAVAILPGMVNAHSHAFQIGLRGRSDRAAAAAARDL